MYFSSSLFIQYIQFSYLFSDPPILHVKANTNNLPKSMVRLSGYFSIYHFPGACCFPAGRFGNWADRDFFEREGLLPISTFTWIAIIIQFMNILNKS